MFSVVLLIILIALNALFALTEMSLMASKKSKMLVLASQEGTAKAANRVLVLKNKPNEVLATTQIGLTFITLVSGAYAEQELTPLLTPWVQTLFDTLALQRWVNVDPLSVSSIVMLVLITLISIIFGEMIPKRIALAYADSIALPLSWVAAKCIFIFAPFIIILARSTNWFLAKAKVPEVSDKISSEDMQMMIYQSRQEGLINKNEAALMKKAWQMDELKITAFMTPRSEIVAIDLNEALQDQLANLHFKGKSNYLIIKGSLDHTLGILEDADMIKFLWWLYQEEKNPTEGAKQEKIMSFLKPIHQLPNTIMLAQTLEAFQKHKVSGALVYNELGHVEGLMTLDDLVAGMIGGVASNQQNNSIHFNGVNEWLIDGLAPFNEVQEALGLKGTFDISTAAGFVFKEYANKQGSLPKEFDAFEFEGFLFQVVDIDRSKGYRIDQILVKRI